MVQQFMTIVLKFEIIMLQLNQTYENFYNLQ
jgi:hypothetical protein